MERNQFVLIIGVAITALAWVTFAEHPTARNLRIALLDTLSL